MTDKSKRLRPLIFLGVGLFNTTLDFIFYTFLTSVIFKKPGEIFVAGIISGTFALLIAFTTHGLITWRGAHLSKRTLLKFFIFTGFGMWILRPLLLSIFIRFNGLYSWVQDILQKVGVDLSYMFIANTLAFGLMLVFVLTYNYIVYEKYVFRQKDA